MIGSQTELVQWVRLALAEQTEDVCLVVALLFRTFARVDPAGNHRSSLPEILHDRLIDRFLAACDGFPGARDQQAMKIPKITVQKSIAKSTKADLTQRRPNSQSNDSRAGTSPATPR